MRIPMDLVIFPNATVLEYLLLVQMFPRWQKRCPCCENGCGGCEGGVIVYEEREE